MFSEQVVSQAKAVTSYDGLVSDLYERTGTDLHDQFTIRWLNHHHPGGVIARVIEG